MERRSVQHLSPGVSPWWGVDYEMSFALYSLRENGNYDYSSWYPGMHLGLRKPGLRNVIVFRDPPPPPPPEDGSPIPEVNPSDVIWDTLYNGYRQHTNTIGIDADGNPHSVTFHAAWDPADFWVVASHNKTLVTFQIPQDLGVYYEAMRCCNGWAWGMPQYISLPTAPMEYPQVGFTYNTMTCNSVSDLNIFEITSPVNDNITSGVDGVVLGEFEYTGSVNLFPGGPSAPFSVKHKGERSNFIVFDLPEDKIPTTYTVRGSVGAAPLLNPEINTISDGYIPGKDGDGNEIPFSTPDGLNAEIGGSVYRARFSLSGTGIATPTTITINSLTQAVEIPGEPMSYFTYPITLSQTQLPQYDQFKPDGIPIDTGLIGQLRFSHAVFSPKEEADPDGHPGYVDLIFRDLDLAEGVTPQAYIDGFESVTITGFSADPAFYTEAKAEANYVLPMLVDIEGGQYLAEAYSSTLHHRATSWYPYSDVKERREGEIFWKEDGLSETYLMRNGQKIVCDGSPLFYIPIPWQSVPRNAPIEVGSVLSLNFSATPPENFYDGSGVPYIIGYTEGKETGIKREVGTSFQTIYRVSRNTPRVETAEFLNQKLGTGNTVYGVYRYIDPSTGSSRIMPFRGVITNSIWNWIAPGGIVPRSVLNGVWRVGMQGAAKFTIQNMTVEVTEVFADRESTSTWWFFGDYYQPFDYYQNLPSSTDPSRPDSYIDGGFIYFDGSFRNLYKTGGYTAGQMLHGTNMSLRSMVEGPYYHSYYGQSFVWKDDYIWSINRDYGSTSPNYFSRSPRTNSDGKIIIPEQRGYFIPRWRIDTSSGVARCVFDDFQIIPEEYYDSLWFDDINATLDPKILKEITDWEKQKIAEANTPPAPTPQEPEGETP